MGRMSFVFRRLVLLVPTAVGVTIITFFMVHLIPGNPAVTILGQHANPSTVAALDRQLGLNQPLAEQYWLFIDRLFHGNLGKSLYYGVPVSSLITSHLPATLWLLCYAAVIAVVISVPLATLAASRKDAVRDHVVARRAAARPWPARLLVRPDPADLAGHQAPAVPGHRLRVRASPATCSRCSCPRLTVAVALCPVLIRSLRASMLGVLGAEFITTARAKGVPGYRDCWSGTCCATPSSRR